MEISDTPLRFDTREQWREWLQENFDKAKGIWFVFPLRSSGEKAISYNDAVEEALCFGWIDSTIRSLDKDHKIQRFTPRNPKSSYSQPNKERLRRLADMGLINETFTEQLSQVLSEEFVYPSDIIEAIREDEVVWEHFQKFSDPYKRIRVAYIDAARKRPDEFGKRLNHLIERTRKGKMIAGYGGIGKYY
ncbi:MAG: YdeI/OmpD-associated family protein [Methanomassiliicoccaceae archaeon]|nr:YdeI/OmpD-associated family protein [Methanomassiliicoccaceae archaeon]